MKSVMIALWDGLKFPYQMRLIEILPVRREPLWYWNLNCWSDSVSCLAEIMWSREIVKKSVKIKLMLQNAIWDLYWLFEKEQKYKGGVVGIVVKWGDGKVRWGNRYIYSENESERNVEGKSGKGCNGEVKLWGRVCVWSHWWRCAS
jgi:hypothetical protein